MSVHSEGHGPDLVLIPGWGSGRALWREFLPRLGARYRCLCVDLPGHGDARAGAPGTIEDYSRRLLDALPAGALWLGWSLGGLVALTAAALRPGAIRALVPVAATPRFTRAQDWPDALPPGSLGGFRAGLEADPEAALHRFRGLCVQGVPGARRHWRRLEAVAPPAPEPAALAATLGWLAGADQRPALADLRVPGTWLLGEGDPLVPPGLAAHLAETLPHWRVTRVPGGGHVPFAVAPETVYRALESLE